MYEDNANKPQQIYLNLNANKVRWLAESKITATNTFAIGSAENPKKVSLWKVEPTGESFEPTILGESEDLDGRVTELKARNNSEFFVSTSNGSVSHFKYVPQEQRLLCQNVWQNKFKSVVNCIDIDAKLDELCSVSENGAIEFIKYNRLSSESVSSYENNELCCLNSVIYLKQFEIAVADSLGRIKLWDTRVKETKKANMTLTLQGECSPILCLAKHPNQQHMIACGNSNGLLFIYDVRSQKKPFIISHTQSEPVLEVCFHPFSSDNLISCSYDGSLWYWNASSKGASLGWDDRNISGKNVLPKNKFTLNSFDINNESVLAVNNNFSLFKIKNLSLF